MTTLHLILDDMLGDVPNGTKRYAEELAGSLLENAPPGCLVEGIIASSPEQDYDYIQQRLPGLSGLFKSALVRRDLVTAWQHGFTPVPSGMIHSPTLFAPLRSHDREHSTGNQIVVTIHEATAWTHPDFLTSREVSRTRTMASRAVRYADAVVVPTHAIAAELDEILGLGDRMRVVNGAVSSHLVPPPDETERAHALELPAMFLVSVGDQGPRHGLQELLQAVSLLNDETIGLLLVGAPRQPGELEAAVREAGLSEGRVRALGALDDDDYATVLGRATAMVYPTITNGFGTPMLEAFRFGLPVVHADTPSLMEVAAESGVAVPSGKLEDYPAALADAIDRTLRDAELRDKLSILGRDREALFSWRAAADAVWQLHADL